MRPPSRRVLCVIMTAVVVGGLAGCGAARKTPPPPPVPLALVPSSVLGGQVGFYIDNSPQAAAAFTADPKTALISSGRLWDVRSNGRLVATLEIAEVKPDVDLAKSSVRDEFTQPILIGAPSDFRLAGQEVEAIISTDGLSTFVWFGKDLFEVLQVKDAPVKPPDLCEAIIKYQQTVPAWQPLPQLYIG